MELISKLQAIGNAIRSKTGKSDLLTLEQMPLEIASITGGGSASTDVPFIPNGLNAELVATYNETFTLADTSFVVGSTPSTSATSIKATVSNRFTSPSITIGDKDIIVVQKVLVTPQYNGEETNTVRELSYAYMYISCVSKGRRSSTDKTLYIRRIVNSQSGFIRYLNSSGVDSINIGTAYGLYCTPSAATVASATANATTVRCSSPSLQCRASTTYSSQANMSKIVDCTWDWNVEVYLCDAQSSMASYVQDEMFKLMFND